MEVFEHHYCWALNEWRTMGRQKRGPMEQLAGTVFKNEKSHTTGRHLNLLETMHTQVQTFSRSLQPPSNKASKQVKLKQFFTRGANQRTKRLTIRSPPHRIASTIDSDVGLRSGSTWRDREAHQRWRIMALMSGRG